MEWISVEDRLPPLKGNFPSDLVIVYCSDGTRCLGYNHKSVMHISCYYCEQDNTVTHWIPLPDRPDMPDSLPELPKE